MDNSKCANLAGTPWQMWVAVFLAFQAVVAHAATGEASICNDDKLPRFEEYASKPRDMRTPTKRAKLRINSEFSRTFPTRLREGLRDNEIGLDGHHIVVTFGCGTTCMYGGFVDVRTGQATALPFVLSDFGRYDLDDQEPIETRADSRLIITRGVASTGNEVGDEDVRGVESYFEWMGSRKSSLRLICERPLRPIKMPNQ